jgi:hypothetical protein
MSADSLREKAAQSQVSPRIKNAIVLLAWLPPLVVLWGVAIAIFGTGIRYARYGTLPDLSGVGSVLDSQLAVVGALGVILAFYWLLSVATFGGDTVETATETADSAAKTIDEHTD